MAQASSPPEAGGGQVSAAAIADGARGLGLELSAAQSEALGRYAGLLERWNRTHNLTAIDAGQTLTHHILDSLAIIGPLQDAHGSRPLRVLDLGSGGGLPGIPLAIAMPHWHLTLLDKVGKKVAFLTQAQLELGLANACAVHARAEQWRPEPAFDLIVARAFSSLAELVACSRHLRASGGRWAAMKGVAPTAELAALAAAEPGLTTTTVRLAVPRLAAARHLVLIR